jgi:hypothetical protein
MLGVVMADLMGELWQAVAIAWACFGFGVILFRMGCRDWHARLLSRGLLFLSPFVLTCFGVHATRENQQLAAIVAAKRSEAIDERIYLASIATADLGDGYQFHSEYYTDGSVKTRGTVPIGEGRASRHFGGTEAWNEGDAGATGRLTPLHDWQGLDGHGSAAGRF